MYSFSRNRSFTMTFECERHRISQAALKSFLPHRLQQSGTIVQPEHCRSSVRGQSRSSKLKLSKLPFSHDLQTSVQHTQRPTTNDSQTTVEASNKEKTKSSKQPDSHHSKSHGDDVINNSKCTRKAAKK